MRRPLPRLSTVVLSALTAATPVLGLLSVSSDAAAQDVSAAASPLELDLAKTYAHAGDQAGDMAVNQTGSQYGSASSPTGGSTADAAAPSVPASSVIRWGDKGCVTVNAFLGYADDFKDIGIVPAAVGISWFPVKNFSIDVQLEGAYVDQPGEESMGGGAAMMLRWHFLDFQTWTLYGDLGVGFLAMSDPVPQNAAEFVFTPRAGVGASIAITDMTRLMVGARWFHISNAETAFENPGINALQGYVGLSVAF